MSMDIACNLSNLFEFSNGINADRSSFGDGIPFANTSEVIGMQSISAGLMPGRIRITESGLARYSLRFGDVLFNRTSETADEIALSCVYLDHAPAVFGGFIFRARPKSDLLDPHYAQYALRASAVRNQMRSLGQGGIRSNIGQKDLKNISLTIPPMAQQSRIADSLSAADDLVSALERLIAKKQAIKQGMMQQLLTGETRLPGFAGEWDDIRLGDHVVYVKTVALSRAELDDSSPLRYLHYGDIHTNTKLLLDAAQEKMPRASAVKTRNAGRLRVGDLVFADASEDPDGIGKSVEIISVPPEGVVPGLHTIAARFNKVVIADGFKAYLQFVPGFREALLRLAAGTKVLATTRTYISSVVLRLPGVNEQRVIAATLRDVEVDIEALQQRLCTAKATKQGMMQELLTGRTRLNAEAVA